MADKHGWTQFEYLHRGSHLSRCEREAALCEFEFALHHLQEAFRRWSSELNASICGQLLPVQDVSVLQVLRMRDRPKSVAEIANALNREDAPNIAYSLRKLEQLGLAERVAGAPRNQTVYQVTRLGRDATDQYGLIRREMLIGGIEDPEAFREAAEKATHFIVSMVGLYDHGARRIGMMRSGDTGLALTRPSRKPKRKPSPAPRRRATAS